MKFSKQQLLIGIILLIIVALCILFFIGDTSSEEFTLLQRFYPDTEKIAPDTKSFYYLLYVKRQLYDYERIQDIIKNYGFSENSFGRYVKSTSVSTFNKETRALSDDGLRGKKTTTRVVTDLKNKYARINSDSGKIEDSFTNKGKKASKSDWQKFANSIFTHPKFLSTALKPEGGLNESYIYISDESYNQLLYDTNVSDANKIINIANYINKTIPGAFEPISQKHKDAIKNQILNWNTNLKDDILSNYLISGLNNNSGSIPYSAAITQSKESADYNIDKIYDLTYWTIVTSNDTRENIINNILSYVSIPSSVSVNVATGNVITGNVITGNVITGKMAT